MPCNGCAILPAACASTSSPSCGRCRLRCPNSSRRLDPSTLAQTPAERLETDEHGGSGLTARFRSITDMSGGALPHLFVEALARAYAAEYIREPQKRSDP